MKRPDNTTLPERFRLIDDILESLTYEQLDILRQRIIEICNDDPADMITISYFDLVTDLFFCTAETEMRNFEDLSNEEIQAFIKDNQDKNWEREMHNKEY